jgi:hypothetical protein
MQITDTILMIRPAAFGANEETATTNFFQLPSQPADQKNIQQSAIKEFDNMVDILRSHGINVLVVDDTPTPVKPSAIFPNNWFSTSQEGVVSVFPTTQSSSGEERRHLKNACR